MAENVNRFVRPQRIRNDKGRRSWSTKEEEVLLAGMKEILAQGWKSENGFRPGYLQVLEGIMVKAFPRTDIKATPHINSRLHTWKKNYGSLFSMLGKTGIGLDHKTKMIEATDEVWDAYVKVDPNARLMRHKSWPYYDDWCEIFGKDRANGTGAEDINEVATEPTGETVAPQPSEQGEELNGVFAGWTDENEPAAVDQPASSSATTKKKTTKKRKFARPHLLDCESVISFCQTASARLGEIAARIGYEMDLGTARKQVFHFVDQIEGLSLQQKLQATKLLGQNTEDLEIFSGLPDEAKVEWAKIKLDGSI